MNFSTAREKLRVFTCCAAMTLMVERGERQIPHGVINTANFSSVAQRFWRGAAVEHVAALLIRQSAGSTGRDHQGRLGVQEFFDRLEAKASGCPVGSIRLARLFRLPSYLR